MKKRYCTIRVAKTKALISCAVTAQLICAFVFGEAKIWFSHDEAHIRAGFLGFLSHGLEADYQTLGALGGLEIKHCHVASKTFHIPIILL